jgi:hypothetical protein
LLAGNLKVSKPLHKHKLDIDNGRPLLIMDAAVVALTGDQEWLHKWNEAYHKHRVLVFQGLRTLSLPTACPQASICIWALIPEG